MSNVVQDIFRDYYEEMIYTLRPRQSVIENVERMINCGDPSFGGAMYGCSKCGTLKFVPFRCHSRFCPTCGTKYSIDRTTSMSFKIINVQHRHCVFTIDSELRHFFLEDRSLLSVLFKAVQSVIIRMFHKINQKEMFTPGFILVLHTFGRDLKWNPHIHCLLSEGGIGNSGFWRAITHFKQIRYYGLYARHRDTDKKIHLALAKEKRKIFLSFNRWRDRILASFGYDPLKCPCCGQSMLFLDLYYNHQHLSLNEMYERAMGRLPSFSSA